MGDSQRWTGILEIKEMERQRDPPPREFSQGARHTQMIEDVAPDQEGIHRLGRDQRQSTGKAEAQSELRPHKTPRTTQRALSVRGRAGRVAARCRWRHINRCPKAELLSFYSVPELHREWRPRLRMVRKLIAALKKFQLFNPDSLSPRNWKILWVWSLKPCQ